MKLSEIVDSTEWNEDIKEEFFNRLRRSPSNYHRGQNCIKFLLDFKKITFMMNM